MNKISEKHGPAIRSFVFADMEDNQSGLYLCDECRRHNDMAVPLDGHPGRGDLDVCHTCETTGHFEDHKRKCIEAGGGCICNEPRKPRRPTSWARLMRNRTRL
jgi:hypothetical protein